MSCMPVHIADKYIEYFLCQYEHIVGIRREIYYNSMHWELSTMVAKDKLQKLIDTGFNRCSIALPYLITTQGHLVVVCTIA